MEMALNIHICIHCARHVSKQEERDARHAIDDGERSSQVQVITSTFVFGPFIMLLTLMCYIDLGGQPSFIAHALSSAFHQLQLSQYYITTHSLEYHDPVHLPVTRQRKFAGADYHWGL